MSHRGIAWAWEQPVENMGQRVVLLALGEMHGHEDGLCFPALDTLTRMAGTNKRRLIRILAELERADLIHIDRGGGRRSNHYILVGLNDLAVPPVAPQSGPGSGAYGGTTSEGVAVPPVAPQGEAGESRSGAYGDTAAVSETARSGAPGVTRTSHQVYHQEQHARARARDAAAAGSPIPAEEYRPPDDLLAELLEERTDLVDHVDELLVRFRNHTWRRRRTAAEWNRKLREWFATEASPATAGGGARDPAWVTRRVETLLSLPTAALGAQLSEDPAMARVFGEAGGPPGVARLKPDELVARYRAAAGDPRPPVPARPALELVKPQERSR